MIALGDPDRPDIAVRLASYTPRRRASAPLAPSTRAALAPLLQQVPRILAAGADLASSSTRFVLTFSPEITRALATGTLQLSRSAATEGAFRAIARDPATGRFVEHGELLRRVNPVAVAAAFWQVAALITAQKFLADIDARLARLEEGIAAIRSFLEDEVLGRLQGSLAYLRDRAQSLRGAPASPAEVLAIMSELERIDREMRGTAQHMMLQMEHQTTELQNENWSRAWWSVEDKVQNGQGRAATMARSSRAALLAGQARLLSASLRGALGLDDGYTSASLRALAEDLAAHRNVWMRFEATMLAKLPAIEATFRRKETEQRSQAQARAALEEAAGAARVDATDLASTVDRLLATLEADRAARALPMELEVTLSPSGEILTVDRLLPA